MRWFYSSSLCENNFRTKAEIGDKIEYCRNLKDPKTLPEFQKILMATGTSWDNSHIYTAHSSELFRDKCENL